MSEHKAADRLAALEEARAQIEIALSSNDDWLAFRQAAAGARRLLYERALAGNPLYKSWELLNEAIDELHAKRAQRNEASAAHDDLTRMPATKTARQTDNARDPSRRTEARSVELHHVLEHIRSDAASRGQPGMAREDEAPEMTNNVELPPAARGNTPGRAREPEQPPSEAVDDAPKSDRVGAVPNEEATVTFIIREPAQATPAGDFPGEQDVRPRFPDRASGTAGSALPPSPANLAEEAEVEIVSRPVEAPVRRFRKV